jgi:hypothetical protein
MDEAITVDVGMGERGYPLEIQLTLQAPRAGAHLVRLAHALHYRSPNQQRETWSPGNIRRDLSRARRYRQQQLSTDDREATQDQLQSLVDYYEQLATLSQATDTRLQLHFRILALIEGHSVVLATTDAEDASAEQTAQ